MARPIAWDESCEQDFLTKGILLVSPRAHGRGLQRGERRLPMALAVIVAGTLNAMLPAEFRLTQSAVFVYPAFLGLLLGVLILGDPGRIDRQSRWLRVTTGLMIASITLAAAVSAVRLVVGILQGAAFAGPHELLAIGAIVWTTLVLAFALWYWHLDSGGPAARAAGTAGIRPAFRFPEHDIDSPVYAGWYPQFVDYFALSFNTATAFSPTDVSAVRHWSKLWLIIQSSFSLVLIGLVLARAINEL